MPVHGGMGDPLRFKCNADLSRMGAAGKKAVVITLAHADPEAVCIKSRARHKDQIQRFRQQDLRPAQDGVRMPYCPTSQPSGPGTAAVREYASPHTG